MAERAIAEAARGAAAASVLTTRSVQQHDRRTLMRASVHERYAKGRRVKNNNKEQLQGGTPVARPFAFVAVLDGPRIAILQ